MEQDSDAGGRGGSGGGSEAGADSTLERYGVEETAIVEAIKRILLRGDVEVCMFLVVGKAGDSIVELLSSDGADLGKILPLVKSVMENESEEGETVN